jgi:universal stress protein A
MEPMTEIEYRRILCATDFSDQARHALGHAALIARAFDGEVHLVHVLALHQDDPVTVEKEMPKAVPPDLEDVVTKRETVRALKPELGLIGMAREGNYDLLVLGTHGRSGLKHVFLGSVAERVVQLAGCPVMTVRAPGHAFEHPDTKAD